MTTPPTFSGAPPSAVDPVNHSVTSEPISLSSASALRRFTITTPEGATEFTGRELATESSRGPGHSRISHSGGFAPRGFRCSACRWFNVTIYEELKLEPATVLFGTGGTQRTEPERWQHTGFWVHTVGGSAVPGEITLGRLRFTPSAFDVVEILTVRNDGEPFIPTQSARALARAASLNADIRDAYVNRAVA